MADAKQCDRCGEFYIKSGVSYTSPKKINGKNISAPANRLKFLLENTSIDTLDLCDSCMQQIIAWIENGKDPKKKDFVL